MITLNQTVSRSARTNPVDVINLKVALKKRGYYEQPDYGITPYADATLFSAIEEFQKDNGLSVDGIVRPKGDTESALNINEPSDRAKSPTTWCPRCGAPHGGSMGDLCPDCTVKS